MRTRTRHAEGGSAVIETVAILAAIVVLAVVMLPVLMRARRPPCHSTCQSLLKECAISLQTYWSDYDSTLPSSAVVNHSQTWGRRDFVRFTTRPGEIPIRSGGHPATWSQLVYKPRKGKDIFFCPDDPVDRTTPSPRLSYFWRAAVDKAWYGVGCTKPCRSESDFAYKGDQIVLYERCGFSSGARRGIRNGVQINVAYMDTHVNSRLIRNSLPADGDRWVTSPVAPGEPAYFNFDNCRSRGQGNPPLPEARPTYTDPSRYSDALPD